MTSMSSIVPIPRTPIAIRVATRGDLAFIDALQKRHTKMVGWMPAKQLEGKVDAGQVLVAEGVGSCQLVVDSAERPASSLPTTNYQLSTTPLGYVIAQDQYFKRDDCGIIYQLNVEATERRKLIGATLVKAVFDRAAYGCRLFCLWCAQDIEANFFWESLGFVPLAFRAGSAQKGRVHIFWQKRIRERDATTPYWFPSQTSAGSIREDRLVLPIPPGKHWSDEMPRILPAESAKPQLPAGTDRARMRRQPMAPARAVSSVGRLSFAPPPTPKKPARVPKPKTKNDPRLIAAARELRDRWLERVNGDPQGVIGVGKYDVVCALAAPTGASVREARALLIAPQAA